MNSAQLHYSSKPVFTLARQSYLSSSATSPDPEPPHSSSRNALLQTVYKNLRQKKLIMKSEKVLLAAVKTYTPVAHHFLFATEEFVNDMFKPVNLSENPSVYDKMKIQQEELSLTTHSSQVLRLCGKRVIQCLPKQHVNQISSALKLVGNFRWTPVPFSKLALSIDECLSPPITTSNIPDNSDVECSLANAPDLVEYQESRPVSCEDPVSQVSTPSIKQFDYSSSSQSTSSMIFHDDGPYRIDSDGYSDMSLPPSTSSLLSATDTLSTIDYEARDLCSRRPSMLSLTTQQSWLGKSTQTVVTVADATGRFVNDRKMTELFN